MKFKIQPGQVFERLTAIKYLGKIDTGYSGNSKSESKKRTKPRSTWLVKCSCDEKEFMVMSNSLLSGHTKSCGCLHSELTIERGKKSIGEKNPMFGKRRELCVHWNPEMSDEERKSNKMRMYQPEYLYWKIEVFKRDKICQLSGEKLKKNLIAHHIFSWSGYEDLRFDVNNGITLEKYIHKLFHRLYGRGYNTREQLEDFIFRYNQKEFDLILEIKRNSGEWNENLFKELKKNTTLKTNTKKRAQINERAF